MNAVLEWIDAETPHSKVLRDDVTTSLEVHDDADVRAEIERIKAFQACVTREALELPLLIVCLLSSRTDTQHRLSGLGEGDTLNLEAIPTRKCAENPRVGTPSAPRSAPRQLRQSPDDPNSKPQAKLAAAETGCRHTAV